MGLPVELTSNSNYNLFSGLTSSPAADSTKWPPWYIMQLRWMLHAGPVLHSEKIRSNRYWWASELRHCTNRYLRQHVHIDPLNLVERSGHLDRKCSHNVYPSSYYWEGMLHFYTFFRVWVFWTCGTCSWWRLLSAKEQDEFYANGRLRRGPVLLGTWKTWEKSSSAKDVHVHFYTTKDH